MHGATASSRRRRKRRMRRKMREEGQRRLRLCDNQYPASATPLAAALQARDTRARHESSLSRLSSLFSFFLLIFLLSLRVAENLSPSSLRRDFSQRGITQSSAFKYKANVFHNESERSSALHAFTFVMDTSASTIASAESVSFTRIQTCTSAKCI